MCGMSESWPFFRLSRRGVHCEQRAGGGERAGRVRGVRCSWGGKGQRLARDEAGETGRAERARQSPHLPHLLSLMSSLCPWHFICTSSAP